MILVGHPQGHEYITYEGRVFYVLPLLLPLPLPLLVLPLPVPLFLLLTPTDNA